MTTLISLIGIVGRMAGSVLNSSLGWASSLLFGRVPRSHQVFVTAILGLSLLWALLILAVLLPGLGSFLRSIVPLPSFVTTGVIHAIVLVALVALPAGVGVAAYLVPAEGERPTGLAAIGQVLRGYPLAVLTSVIVLFLPAVGIVRKVRSVSRGWSDTHVPIVVKPGGYERMVDDLKTALAGVDLPVTARPAPAILSTPGRLMALVAGRNVQGMLPDRLVELRGRGLRIGVYPSDIAISGTRRQGTRARAAVLSRLATTSAHLTTSAESQAVEDRLERIAMSEGASRREIADVDEQLLHLEVPPDDWDILYRLRLQAERDVLRRRAAS
jgi:hypothetical protein